MLSPGTMAVIEKIIHILNRILVILGGLFLVGMCILTCTNIVFRFTWIPIRGTFELMGFMGAVMAAFSLGYTRIKRGHISVTVLIDSFSMKTRHLLNLDALFWPVCCCWT